MARYAQHVAWGTTVVAAILFLAAFVALFRHDLGDPIFAAVTFAVVGIIVWLIGWAVAYVSRRPSRWR